MKLTSSYSPSPQVESRAKSFSPKPSFAHGLISSASDRRMILPDFARIAGGEPQPQPSLPTLSITHHFTNLTDPRPHRRRRHQLLDIIAIAICGVICGCKSWGDRRLWPEESRLVANLPGTPRRPPAEGYLPPGARSDQAGPAFQSCLRGWMQALATTLGVKQIAIDGKTVRRSHDRVGGGSRPCTW